MNIVQTKILFFINIDTKNLKLSLFTLCFRYSARKTFVDYYYFSLKYNICINIKLHLLCTFFTLFDKIKAKLFCNTQHGMCLFEQFFEHSNLKIKFLFRNKRFCRKFKPLYLLSKLTYTAVINYEVSIISLNTETNDRRCLTSSFGRTYLALDTHQFRNRILPVCFWTYTVGVALSMETEVKSNTVFGRFYDIQCVPLRGGEARI